MVQKYYNFCKCAKVSYPISHIFRIYDSITVRLPCEILKNYCIFTAIFKRYAQKCIVGVTF